MILALTLTIALTLTLVLNLVFHQSVIGDRNYFSSKLPNYGFLAKLTVSCDLIIRSCQFRCKKF